MKLLDRGLQRDLLNQLAEAYPNPLNGLFDPYDLESANSVNLHYLEEHGLVMLSRPQRVLRNNSVPPGLARRLGPEVDGSATITAAGMDFIQADGGLSAILGVVTVRLHSETIAEIEAKILASDQPEPEKTKLLDRLRSMPEEGLRALTQELVRAGLNRGPEIWETVLRALSG